MSKSVLALLWILKHNHFLLLFPKKKQEAVGTCSETFAFKCYTNFTQMQENFDKSLFRSTSNKIVAQFIDEKPLALVVNAILEVNFYYIAVLNHNAFSDILSCLWSSSFL